MSDLIDFPPATTRDLRLDVFRGIALISIYINHVPGTVFESLTSRNFGYSDAAEGFVIMSGMAAGLAYSGGLRQGVCWPAIGRIWHRAWVLYLVHLMTTLAAIAVVAAGAIWLDAGAMLGRNNFGPIFATPLAAEIGIPLLTHQIGYANILPMYAVLLLAAPFAILVGLRHPGALLAGAVALWALAGTHWLNLPNYPNSGGWYFNPVSWQVIFVIGLLTGIAMRRGGRLVPVRLWAQLLAAGYLLAALICLELPSADATLGSTLWWIQDSGVPPLFTTFEKTYLTLPRLLHILALAYLISALPVLRRFAAAPLAAPLALLGRHSLPVFALGTVLAYVAQVIKEATPDSLALDSALIGAGIGLLFVIAIARDRLHLDRKRPILADAAPRPAEYPALPAEMTLRSA